MKREAGSDGGRGYPPTLVHGMDRGVRESFPDRAPAPGSEPVTIPASSPVA